MSNVIEGAFDFKKGGISHGKYISRDFGGQFQANQSEADFFFYSRSYSGLRHCVTDFSRMSKLIQRFTRDQPHSHNNPKIL